MMGVHLSDADDQGDHVQADDHGQGSQQGDRNLFHLIHPPISNDIPTGELVDVPPAQPGPRLSLAEEIELVFTLFIEDDEERLSCDHSPVEYEAGEIGLEFDSAIRSWHNNCTRSFRARPAYAWVKEGTRAGLGDRRRLPGRPRLASQADGGRSSAGTYNYKLFILFTCYFFASVMSFIPFAPG